MKSNPNSLCGSRSDKPCRLQLGHSGGLVFAVAVGRSCATLWTIRTGSGVLAGLLQARSRVASDMYDRWRLSSFHSSGLLQGGFNLFSRFLAGLVCDSEPPRPRDDTMTRHSATRAPRRRDSILSRPSQDAPRALGLLADPSEPPRPKRSTVPCFGVR